MSHDQQPETDGDPSAMGEAPALPPLRKFRIIVRMPFTVEARTVQDAVDLARHEWGDKFTGTLEAM